MVEFGRISSGLFYDIISPLTNVALNLKDLKIEDAKETLKYLTPSIIKIENIIRQSKRQMTIDKTYALFSIREEISSVIEILKSKMNKNNIKIKFYQNRENILIHGSPTLFSHIIMNLLSNGIDSHEEETGPGQEFMNKDKIVTIMIKKKDDKLCVKVIDNGCGIDKDMLDKIFEPFYTTKRDHGCGIGLSATKHILEKYFNGKIEVKSKITKGTSFVLTIPIVEKKQG